MGKTHLAIGIFAALFFMPHVTNKWVFIPVVLFASLLPDADNGFSTLGKKGIFKPIQWISKHRGIFHTFTLCIVISLVFALYIPALAFGFFLGYALHLLADSWTVEGIKPFWPLKGELKGRVRTGGTVEQAVFIIFAILDVIFLLLLFV